MDTYKKEIVDIVEELNRLEELDRRYNWTPRSIRIEENRKAYLISLGYANKSDIDLFKQLTKDLNFFSQLVRDFEALLSEYQYIIQGNNELSLRVENPYMDAKRKELNCKNILECFTEYFGDTIYIGHEMPEDGHFSSLYGGKRYNV